MPCHSPPKAPMLAGLVAELLARHLVVLEAVAAQVPVPQAQVGALQRQLELLGALPALARGARLEPGEGPAPPWPRYRPNAAAAREDDEEDRVLERLLAPGAEDVGIGAADGDDQRLVHVQLDGGDRLRSAVIRASLEPPTAPRDHGRTRRGMLRARHLRRPAAASRPRAGRVLRGMVTNTLPSAVAERDPHVGRVQHRAHQHLEVLGLEGGDGGADEGAVRGDDRPPEDDRVVAERGLERRGDVERCRALRGLAARGSSRGRRSRGRAARRRWSRRPCPSASSTTIERTPGMASLSTLSRAESRVETSGAAAWRGSRRARSPGRG